MWAWPYVGGWKYVEESPLNPFSIFSPLISTDYEDEKKIEGLRLGIEEVVEVIKKKDHIIQCWNKEGVRVASHFHYHKGRNFFKWSRSECLFWRWILTFASSEKSIIMNDKKILGSTKNRCHRTVAVAVFASAFLGWPKAKQTRKKAIIVRAFYGSICLPASDCT